MFDLLNRLEGLQRLLTHPYAKVVCPLALKDQWVEEISQKSDLSVILYHGTKRANIAHKLHKYRVVVTTYDGQSD